MSYPEAAFLGLLQGLTEFFPVSSSGHLVLVQALLKVKQPGVNFEILVHLGSLLAVLIYFREKIAKLVGSLFVPSLRQYRTQVVYLIVGTIPAAVIGLSFRSFFEQAFSSPLMTSSMLLVTGAVLLATRFVPVGQHKIRWPKALVIGLGQACALMPGISRSGTTIAVGMMSGVKPSEAAEFSFLLAVPAIGGAFLLQAPKLAHIQTALAGQYLLGVSCSFIASLFAVYAVLALIRRGKFMIFAYYCFAAGMLGLYLFL